MDKERIITARERESGEKREEKTLRGREREDTSDVVVRATLLSSLPHHSASLSIPICSLFSSVVHPSPVTYCLFHFVSLFSCNLNECLLSPPAIRVAMVAVETKDEEREMKFGLQFHRAMKVEI